MSTSTLGRRYKLYLDAKTASGTVKVVAYDPRRGWFLVGKGYAPAWVSFTMFRSLLREGVLVDC